MAPKTSTFFDLQTCLRSKSPVVCQNRHHVLSEKSEISVPKRLGLSLAWLSAVLRGHLDYGSMSCNLGNVDQLCVMLAILWRSSTESECE